MSKGLVLVTGTTGYLGGHVVDILLKEGYSVRAIVRTGKSKAIKDTFPDAGSKLETSEVADMITSDFKEAVKGVTAIIHTASPNFTDGTTTDQMLKNNIDGSINIFKAGLAAGVKKMVYTSTVGALFNADFARPFSPETIGPNDWSNITLDQIDPAATPVMLAYLHSKSIAEKEFWKLADAHPDADFSSVIPPIIWGPRLASAPYPSTRAGLSTIDFVNQLIMNQKDYPANPLANFVHVRDCAQIHVSALSGKSLPKGHPVKYKRFIAIPPEKFAWVKTCDIIRSERPALASSTVPKDAAQPPQTVADYDSSLVGELLGLKGWKSLKETILETVDYVVECRKVHPEVANPAGGISVTAA